MEWYVLQVITGKEEAVSNRLMQKQLTALVPKEQRLIRSGGQWHKQLYTLFPGYVFIKMDYTISVFYQIMEIPGIARVLCMSGAPSPLPHQEADYILWLGERALLPSKAELLSDGSWHIVSGVLVDLQDRIIKIDKHRRRAKVQFSVLGQMKIIELSIELINT